MDLDPFVQKFLAKVEQGELLQFLEELISSPNESYPQFQELSPRLLVNYIDATLFGSTQDAFMQYQILRLEPFLKLEEALFFLLLFKKKLAEKPFLNEWLFLEKGSGKNFQLPNELQPLWNFHAQMVESWLKLKQHKPLFCKRLNAEFSQLHPWYPLQYGMPRPALNILEDVVPLLFVEPI